MATATVEKLLEEITALPEGERALLLKLMDQQTAAKKKESQGKFVDPIPEPDQQGTMKWLADHGREYEGQWVALDGYKLIAHNTDYYVVSKAAKASGAYLPMITFVEPMPEHPFVRV